MISALRSRSALVSLLTVLGPLAALADAEVDCRTAAPARVVPACTERLTQPGLTPAQRINALLYRSWAHTDLKAFEAAEADVNEIFKVDPNSAIGYSARGRLRHFLGNNDLALSDYNQSVALAQNKYTFLLNRGLFFIRTANFEPARTDYEAAMALDPKKAAPYLGRARVYRQRNSDEAALKDLDMAVSLEPDQPTGYLDRGELLLAMKLPRRALADFDKALALAKNSTRATRGRETALGMLSTDGGSTTGAPSQPTATAPTSPPPATAAPAKSDPPKTVQPASAPVSPTVSPPVSPAAPSQTEAQLQQAVDLRKTKKYRDALAIYDKVLASEPESFRAMLGRAAAFEEAEEYRDAFKGYEALKASKAPPEFKLSAFEGVTRVLAIVGDYRSAAANATEALKLNPKSDEALFWRGLSLVRQHRYAQAVADFRAAEQNLRSASWESYALAVLGDHANALTRADSVTKANDKMGLPFVTRARVALAKGDIAKAEDENRRASQLSTMPEVKTTAQLILLSKLLKPGDAPLPAKRN